MTTEASAQPAAAKTRGRKSRSVNEPAPVVSTPAPAKAAKAAKKVAKADKTAAHAHPKFIDMITESLEKLNERSGSSRQAILKYIVANFPVDQKNSQPIFKGCY